MVHFVLEPGKGVQNHTLKRVTTYLFELFLEGIRSLPGDLHPHQANAGHDTGGKNDKRTEGITDPAAS